VKRPYHRQKGKWRRTPLVPLHQAGFGGQPLMLPAAGGAAWQGPGMGKNIWTSLDRVPVENCLPVRLQRTAASKIMASSLLGDPSRPKKCRKTRNNFEGTISARVRWRGAALQHPPRFQFTPAPAGSFLDEEARGDTGGQGNSVSLNRRGLSCSRLECLEPGRIHVAALSQSRER
jgi:hypothetical protein